MHEPHLSRDELVDLVEGTLSTNRAGHAQRCARCGRHAAELRDALAAARGVEVPEPSPLFWTALATRVRDAVAQEPNPSPLLHWTAWRGLRLTVGLTAALALLALMAGTMMVRSTIREHGQTEQRTMATDVTGAAPAAGEQLSETAVAAGWSLVLQMSEDLDWGDSGELELPAWDVVDLAVLELSPAERRELARLLEVELNDLM